MVMDENGRNGKKWHLAQQFTQPVIKPHIMQSYITIIITQIWGFYKYQKFPPHPIIIIYNLLTNR